MTDMNYLTSAQDAFAGICAFPSIVLRSRAYVSIVDSVNRETVSIGLSTPNASESSDSESNPPSL